jgi:phenylacetate-CoA ligase
MTMIGTTGLGDLQDRMQGELTARLAAHLKHLDWDADRLAAYQAERLRTLLARAIERSPFHASRLGHIDPARFEIADLGRLPTMTSADMMASFDDVVTDRRLSRRSVEGHLRSCGRQASLLLGDYVCLASGGSSGQRGVFVQTIGEYADFAASLMRRALARRAAAGGQPAALIIGLVGAAAPVHSSGFAAAVARGGAVRLLSVPATLPLPDAVDRLNALQPPALLGYPSKLAELAAEQLAGRLSIAPQSVTAMGETLTGADRAAITAGFGVPVTDQFVSTEGLAGVSEPGEPVLTFASDMCIAEPVDDSGRPVPDGTASAKVLVTNLHNLTQPLIRYEPTDHFTARPGPAARGHLQATVRGRVHGIFRYGPARIHPHAIRSVMDTAPAVTEYQVRQTRRGIDLAVIAGRDLDLAALTAALSGSLRQAGLPDPDVTVHIADTIARHPDTGKVRRFIPIQAPEQASGEEA